MGKNNTEQLAVAKKYLGKGGATFRKYCGLPSGAAWCAAFVTYIFNEAGNSSLFFGGKKVTYCPTAMKWCDANLAQIPVYLALPSDIIFFDWEPNGVPNHIGFVRERKSDAEVYTIEGNTSGGIVANKTRTAKYVCGCYRPHFKATYKLGKIDVDGYFGYNSIANLQKALGVTVDGILGKGTVKALQKKVGVTQDGSWGPKTSKAVQKMVGTTVDGAFGAKSVKALQTWINKQNGYSSTSSNKTATTTNKTASTASTANKTTTATTTKYTGALPSIHVAKTTTQVIADAVKWGKLIASNNSFHYGHGKDAHHNGCYFCGTQPKSKKNSGIVDYEKTYCCNPFVHACFAHGGLVTAMLAKCQKGSSYGFSKNEGYAKSSQFKAMGKLSKDKLVKGDVLCSDSHVALYVGDGKVVQAGHEDDNKRNSSSWNSSIAVGTWNGYTRVYRFIGKVDADVPIRFGEYSDRVKQIQAFLNWYYGKKILTEDGIFFSETLKYVKAFQTAQKIAVDGIVGVNTLAKMKVTKPSPSSVTSWQDKANAWAKEIYKSGNYKYVTWTSKVKATTQCPICHPRTGYQGWNCIGFAFACWHHGGGLKSKCNCGVISNGVWENILKAKTDAEANKIASARVGIPVKVIRNGGKAIPLSKLKKGDICALYNNNQVYHHTFYYMGDGKYADSTSGRTPNIKAGMSMSSYTKSHLKVAIRYEG